MSITELKIPSVDGSSIPALLYLPKVTAARHHETNQTLPLYVHLHSGGWHLGTLYTEDPFCAHLCSSFSRRQGSPGLAVLNVNYRHTPEHCFPAQRDDVTAALQYVVSGLPEIAEHRIDPKQVIFGGTSAGGHLAIGAAVLASLGRGEIPQIRPKGLILTCPPTVHMDLFPYDLMQSRDVQSYIQNAEADLLPASRCRTFWDLYLSKVLSRDGGDNLQVKKQPEISPLLAPSSVFDVNSWPPTTFHIAGMDCLRDEGLLFETKLKELGIKTRLHVYQGYPHAFNMLPQLKASKQWREAMEEDIAWLLI